MNRDMKRAVGEFGEQGDVEAIMESVERLMGIYKRALLWRQSFSLIDTKEEYRNLMEIFFSLISNSVFQIFDTLYKKSRRGLSLIKDCLEGRIPADELELDLAVKIEIDKESFELILQDLEEA